MSSTTDPQYASQPESDVGNGAIKTAGSLGLPESGADVPTGHPPAFWFIFWGEFAERCSYYGMRAILPLYLTSALLFPDEKMTPIYSYFKSACYFLPLLGGYLADRFFGKYWTIVGFSVPYVLGHFILGIQTELALFIALALLAGGSGVIKPNISTLMGKTYDQKRPGQKALLTSAFLWFYFSINVGATLSLWGLPKMRDHFIDTYLARYDLKQEAINKKDDTAAKAWFATFDGTRKVITQEEADELKLQARRYAYPLAFQVPAWLMVAALGAFAFGKRFYAVETIGRNQVVSPEESAERWRVLGRLAGVFGLIVFFWVAYEQNDNLWTLFARDHIAERFTDPSTGREVETCVLRLGSWQTEYPPDGFQFINSLLIIILVPLFGYMWRTIDPTGKRFPPATKIFWGFLWTAAASGVMALAAFQAAGGEKVSAWWMVLGYFVLTIGEILLYGTGLELSYTAAPANMKGFVTACFLVTNTLGNLINTQLSPLYQKTIPEGKFFAMTGGIVVVAAIAFYFVGRRLTASQSQESPVAA
jgi:POT family proton-dependent oligopeptide transporter